MEYNPQKKPQKGCGTTSEDSPQRKEWGGAPHWLPEDVGDAEGGLALAFGEAGGGGRLPVL